MKPRKRRGPVSRATAEEAVRTLRRWSGDDPTREGLLDTPKRVVDAYRDWFSGYATDPAAYLRRTFEEGRSAEGLPTISLDLAEGTGILAALVAAGFASSNGEARRSIQGGAIRVNETEPDSPFGAVPARVNGSALSMILRIQLGRIE